MTDTIPEDVMEAAKSTANAVCAQVAGSHVIIARAILAERERCAKIADDLYGTYDGTPFDNGSGSCGFNDACRDIADAIRKGDTP